MKKIVLSFIMFTIIIYAEGAFSLGGKNFSFSISQDSGNGYNYTVLGGSINYFVADGLATGLSFTTWLGDKPSINQITIPLTYYIPLESEYRPYLGLFYSRTFMGDDGDIKYEDYNSYGGRAGVAMQLSNNAYMSIGWVQEKYDDGREKSSRGYPEFSGGFSF